ncbi:MAG TPA: hypothetical protein PKX93_12120, partial [bacterium]|nr:hypothetical protein [bacterium]
DRVLLSGQKAASAAEIRPLQSLISCSRRIFFLLSWYILKLLFKKRSISASVLYLNRLKTVFGEITSLPDTGSTDFSSKKPVCSGKRLSTRTKAWPIRSKPRRPARPAI